MRVAMESRAAPLLSSRLDPASRDAAPLAVARIDETRCIGCTLCRQACPVDAIVGAARRMHTVLPVLCVGCELCLPPCPVDCIALVPAGRAWSAEDARAARARFDARTPAARNGGQAEIDIATPMAHEPAADETERTFRRRAAAAALLRARARRRAAKRSLPPRSR
jgi:electron transport complex protein RnfB